MTTPGVLTTNASAAADATLVTVTAGLRPPVTTIWASWVPTTAARPMAEARRGRPVSRPAGGPGQRRAHRRSAADGDPRARVLSGDLPPRAVPSAMNASSPAFPPTRIDTASRRLRHSALPSRTDPADPADIAFGQYQARGVSRRCRAARCDADTDIGQPDRRGVVGAIPDHGHHVPAAR